MVDTSLSANNTVLNKMDDVPSLVEFKLTEEGDEMVNEQVNKLMR